MKNGAVYFHLLTNSGGGGDGSSSIDSLASRQRRIRSARRDLRARCTDADRRAALQHARAADASRDHDGSRSHRVRRDRLLVRDEQRAEPPPSLNAELELVEAPLKFGRHVAATAVA